MVVRKKKEKATAPKPAPRRIRRVFWVAFKWCRISVLLALLVVVLLGLFLNRVGLPVSFQQRIIEEARARGWALDFSRLRLRWYRGFVAENVALSRTDASVGPYIFVETAELDPNLEALRHLRLQLDGVRLAGGRVIWPIPTINGSSHAFALEDVRGDVRFRPNDEWELRSFDALSFGARLHVRGNVTNASLLREWKFPGRPGLEAGREAMFWNRLVREARQVHFDPTPELTAIFSGDARAPSSLAATVKFVATTIESRWARIRDVRLNGELIPSSASSPAVRAQFKLTVGQGDSPGGAATHLELSGGLELSSLTNWVPTNAALAMALRSFATRWTSATNVTFRARGDPLPARAGLRGTSLEATADQLSSPWGACSQFRLTGDVLQSSTNLLPATLRADLDLGTPHTRWATSDWAHVNLQAELPGLREMRLFQTNVTWLDRWTNLTFYALTTLANAKVGTLSLESVRLTNRWQAPLFHSALQARAGEGAVTSVADLRMADRRLDFKVAAVLPIEELVPLLATNAQRVLAGHKTEAMPRLQTAGTVILPVWINLQPDWRGEVLPTLSLSGMLEGGKGSYRGVTYNAIYALFEFTNQVLRAPEIRLARSEGSLQADLSSDTRTGAIRCRVRSGIDPQALQPLLSARARSNTLDLFEFTQPPSIEAVLMTRGGAGRSLGLEAEVALTNLAFRSQTISSCTARVLYTNALVSILHPVVLRPGERGEAEGIGIDLERRRLYLTNATGNLAPHAIAKAIGPITYRDVSPYLFDVPPQARVEGSVPIGHSDLTENMRFDIDGGVFRWRKFAFDQIRGTVFWRSNTVTLTNIQARWCSGDMGGWLFVDFSPTNTDLLSFHATLHEAGLRAIVRQMNPSRSNRLEGLLSGELNITRADLSNDLSWMGYGYAHLTNGLVWDLPLFGVFSPVLNAFIPGLGNSRARHADAIFGITNSVIHSRDLEIRATMMRMQFRGTVDFAEHVEGRMEAELLRDLPALGFVISKVFWPVTKLFEYRVTGKLANPKTEQVYAISKVLLFPFQPIKTLKELFGQEGSAPEDSLLEPGPPPGLPTPPP